MTLGFKHERAHRGAKDEWLTPPWVLQAIGPFDLDPCAPRVRPWMTAENHLTEEDDGLAQPWRGRVWLNPPYGPQTFRWLSKLADHGCGTSLIFARTETKGFAEQVWKRADAVLFLTGRLRFFNVDGSPGPTTAGAPSVLVAYGLYDTLRLRDCGLKGHFIDLRFTR